MFSPSLFTKQQMELLFDHSTKSFTEISREAAASANSHREVRKVPLPEVATLLFTTGRMAFLN
jgi:hypothetical protein